MNFFKKAISTSIVFALASSSSCYVKGYTSGELKDLMTRLLWKQLLPNGYMIKPDYLSETMYSRAINNTKNIEKKFYKDTLNCLTEMEKAGYTLSSANFNDYYSRLTRILNDIERIIYNCKKCQYTKIPHWPILEYLFSYPSNLEKILSNINMAVLIQNFLNLELNGPFDGAFFKVAWKTQAISEWVWCLCKNRSTERMKSIEKILDYEEAKANLDETYDNIYWPNVAASVMRILAFQHYDLINT